MLQTPARAGPALLREGKETRLSLVTPLHPSLHKQIKKQLNKCTAVIGYSHHLKAAMSSSVLSSPTSDIFRLEWSGDAANTSKERVQFCSGGSGDSLALGNTSSTIPASADTALNEREYMIEYAVTLSSSPTAVTPS
jgi:hypothetical protein